MMKKVLSIVLIGIVIMYLSSCHTSQQGVANQQTYPVEASPRAAAPAPNIHVTVNVEPAVASTPQDVFLHTWYNCNAYLLDSVHTDGNTTLNFSGYIPFQNEVELTFEKRGVRALRLILSPGDSVSFNAPAESEIAFENEVELPQLSAQTEWNEFTRQNRKLRSRVDSLVSLIVHTPKTDKIRLKTLQDEFDRDSLAIHDMFANMAFSEQPYMANFSLIFLNIDYKEDYLYKDTLLKRFPDYLPLKLHYKLEPDAAQTPETKRFRAKINKIKNERATLIRFSESTKKSKLKAGRKLELDLHQISGETKDLSMFGGKYVLVDLWASWCKPCVDNMRPLVDVQKKYARDFEVCAITIDKLPGAWTRRIESVGMQNFHHFVGVDFSTGKLYPDVEALGFKAIPQNYLLDREGKIIAINICGEELIKKLEELIIKSQRDKQ